MEGVEVVAGVVCVVVTVEASEAMAEGVTEGISAGGIDVRTVVAVVVCVIFALESSEVVSVVVDAACDMIGLVAVDDDADIDFSFRALSLADNFGGRVNGGRAGLANCAEYNLGGYRAKKFNSLCGSSGA